MIAGDSATPDAAAALEADRERVIERWLLAWEHSVIRLPRPIDKGALAALARGIADELALGLRDADPAPGHRALREVEKRVAFAGGTLGQTGASAFDIVAFVLALRDVLVGDARGAAERERLGTIFDWLSALALEGYVTSREDALRLRHREELERGTPVVMIGAELPAALLVGEPDRSVLDGCFGRLLLAVVRVGARAVVIDGSGLMKPAALNVLDALGTFAQHRKIKGAVVLVVTGLGGDAELAWREAAAGAELRHEERFEDAVSTALSVGGWKLAKRQ